MWPTPSTSIARDIVMFAAVCARDRAEAMEGLGALAASQPVATVVGPRDIRCGPRTVFVYSGQGSEWAGMGRQLLADEPAFAAAIRELEPEFLAEKGFSLSEVLASGEDVVGVDRDRAGTGRLPACVDPTLASLRCRTGCGHGALGGRSHCGGGVRRARRYRRAASSPAVRAAIHTGRSHTICPHACVLHRGDQVAGRTYGTFIEVSPHPLLTETIKGALRSVDHEVLSSMNRHHPETLHFHLQLAALAAQPGRSITTIAPVGGPAHSAHPWHHVTHWLTDRAAGSYPTSATRCRTNTSKSHRRR